jgi:ribonuclease VapC
MIREEDGHRRLAAALEGASSVAAGTPTIFEAAMVLTGRTGAPGDRIVSRFLADNGIASVPFDDRHRSAACEAFTRYGKGRHPAGLNYGDCMTYATARLAGAPLLFTGDDFSRTDLEAA